MCDIIKFSFSFLAHLYAVVFSLVCDVSRRMIFKSCEELT